MFSALVAAAAGEGVEEVEEAVVGRAAGIAGDAA
jgi:hypothetical protein